MSSWDILNDISIERARQKAKYCPEIDICFPGTDNNARLQVMCEKLGKIALAINQVVVRENKPELRTELIQMGEVVLAWCEGLEMEGEKGADAKIVNLQAAVGSRVQV